MGERLVRFRHAVRVFTLLDRTAAQVRRIEQLVRELLLHRLAVATRARVADQPADAQRQAPVRIHFDGHLVVGAADAPRLDLETRLHVVERLLEDLERIVAGALLDNLEALVEDALRSTALAIAHDRVDELAHQRAVIERVWSQFALRNLSSTRHISLESCRDPGCGIRNSRTACARPELRVPSPELLLRSLRAVLRTTLLAPLH